MRRDPFGVIVLRAPRVWRTIVDGVQVKLGGEAASESIHAPARC